MENKITIEIWTDIMCPYCYLGKKNFEEARKDFEFNDQIEVIWKAYPLNSDLPGNGKGIPVVEYLTNYAGLSEDAINNMFQNIEELSKKAGVKFNLWNGIAANTKDAHRLIKLAHTIGQADKVVDALGKAYFEDAKDYSNIDVLLEIGTDSGLKETTIRQMLESDDFLYEIQQDVQEAQNLGFDTVPTFLVDRRQAIIGSESVDLFKKVLDKSFKDWRLRVPAQTGNIKVKKGKSCNADGTCEI